MAFSYRKYTKRFFNGQASAGIIKTKLRHYQRLRAITDYYSEGSGGYWYALLKDGSELEYCPAGSVMGLGGAAGWWYRPSDSYDPAWIPDNGSGNVSWINDLYPYQLLSGNGGTKATPTNPRYRFPTE